MTEEKEIAFMEINVNGQNKKWFNLRITYDQAVMLAFGVIGNELNYTYTVTYSHGEDNAQGSLLKGEKVRAVLGMIFNVSMANKS